MMELAAASPYNAGSTRHYYRNSFAIDSKVDRTAASAVQCASSESRIRSALWLRLKWEIGLLCNQCCLASNTSTCVDIVNDLNNGQNTTVIAADLGYLPLSSERRS